MRAEQALALDWVGAVVEPVQLALTALHAEEGALAEYHVHEAGLERVVVPHDDRVHNDPATRFVRELIGKAVGKRK